MDTAGHRRRGRAWWLLAVSAAATSAVLAVVGQLYTGVVATAAVAAVAAVMALVADRLHTRLTNAVDGQPIYVRRMRDLDDPLRLGVHPGAALDGVRVTPYMERDRMPDLLAALRDGGFILVVGDSTAGKTRLAYEAMRVILPQYLCIDPSGPDGLATAIATAAATRRSVLWLDDLERYLGVSGLSYGAVEDLIGGPRGAIILATMRTHARDALSPRHDSGRTGTDRHAARAGREVLAAVTHEIILERRWSDIELAAAQVHSGDPRIASALRNADRYGVAEHISAGPEMLTSLRDAWSSSTIGGGPRGAALVTATVDARRASYHRPLTLDLLNRLHEIYLAERGHNQHRVVSLPEALQWATQPLYATSSLLEPIGDGYLAFDYLVDAAANDPNTPPIPRAVWEILIEHADPDDAADIIWQATFAGHADLATAAFDRAMAANRYAAAVSIAQCIADEGDDQTAVAMLEQVVTRATEDPTVSRDNLLRFREALAWIMGEYLAGHGDPARALSIIRLVATETAELLGEDHPDALGARINLARQTGATGNPDEALRLATSAASQAASALGAGHHVTMSARFEVAVWTSRVHGPRSGVECWTVLLDDARSATFTDDEFSLHAQGNLAECLIEASEPEAAADLLHRLILVLIEKWGRDHFHTLVYRIAYARALHHTGATVHAAQLMAAAAEDCDRVLGNRHATTRQARQHLEQWRIVPAPE